MHSILFTYGYQGSTPEQLLAYAREHRAVVLDIRYAPRSRWPDWNKLALLGLLGQERYHWLQALGNLNYQGGPITIQDLDYGTRFVERLLEEQNVILLCACWNVETCHRSLVADHISAACGAPVIHLPAKAQGSQPENQVKGLSLYQPWATLCAIGAKRWETRSWATSYRGRLAIHAGLKLDWEQAVLLTQEPFRTVLHAAGIVTPGQLPRGVILATCRLTEVCLIKPGLGMHPNEWKFGDFTPGRFYWALRDVKPLDPPVPARGMQGLWDATAVLSAAGVTW